MEPATIVALAKLGFEVANKAVDAYAKHSEKNDEYQNALRETITESSNSLGKAIENVAEVVIEKLESDKLEELNSRTKNLSFLISTGNDDQVLQYSMMLNESVDYASNRIKEGKLHWIGPWLVGVSVVFSALEVCGGNGNYNQFKHEIKRGRYMILDAITKQLVYAQDHSLPWMEIERFLNGTSTEILEHEHLKFTIGRVGGGFAEQNSSGSSRESGSRYSPGRHSVILLDYGDREQMHAYIKKVSGWPSERVDYYFKPPIMVPFIENISKSDAHQIVGVVRGLRGAAKIL